MSRTKLRAQAAVNLYAKVQFYKSEELTALAASGAPCLRVLVVVEC